MTADGAASSHFGASAAVTADVNGDGHPDLIVGVPNINSATGVGHIYYGGPAEVKPRSRVAAFLLLLKSWMIVRGRSAISGWIVVS